jgi:hypothetical protein
MSCRSRIRPSSGWCRDLGSLLDRLRALGRTAAFSNLVADNRSVDLGSPEMNGGIIEGVISPGTTGWPHPSSLVYLDLHVICEARRGTDAVLETANILTDKQPATAPLHFVCLYVGPSALAWRRIHPTSFRVRLVASVFRDSVMTPWEPVLGRAR